MVNNHSSEQMIGMSGGGDVRNSFNTQSEWLLRSIRFRFLSIYFLFFEDGGRTRNDLHYAADSVTSAMSTLVRELNSGMCLAA